MGIHNPFSPNVQASNGGFASPKFASLFQNPHQAQYQTNTPNGGRGNNKKQIQCLDKLQPYTFIPQANTKFSPMNTQMNFLESPDTHQPNLMSLANFNKSHHENNIHMAKGFSV